MRIEDFTEIVANNGTPFLEYEENPKHNEKWWSEREETTDETKNIRYWWAKVSLQIVQIIRFQAG